MAEPKFVKVSPRADSRLNDCFADVQRNVEELGGRIQHGWTIWHWPGIFAEAEFHAVWQTPAGELLDVSAKKNEEDTILFAADATRVFRDRRVPNIRLATSRDPRVLHLFQLHDRFNKLMDDLMKDAPFGTKFEIRGEPLEIQKRIARLQLELMQSRDARRAVAK